VAAHPMCCGKGTRLGDDQNAGKKKKTSAVTASWHGLVSSLSVKLRSFGSSNLAEGIEDSHVPLLMQGEGHDGRARNRKVQHEDTASQIERHVDNAWLHRQLSMALQVGGH
jgi:hypothetical protein